MINLEIVFAIHFDDDKITDEDLKKFTQVLIERLRVNNENNKYTPMITLTQAAFDGLYTNMSSEIYNEAVKQSATKAVDDVIARFKEEVDYIEGDVKKYFRLNKKVIEEFFPYGITEYKQANKSNIELLMGRLITASGNHTSVLPANFIVPVSDLKAEYDRERQNQLQKMGMVADDRATCKTLRAVLERQLWLDVLDLAKEYVGNPTEGMKFFDQSIIRKWKKSNKPGGSQVVVYTGEVDAETKLTIDEKEFAETQKFNIENSGETILHFYLAAAPADEVPPTAIILQPGDEGEYTALQLGAKGNKFLMVYNPDKENVGDYVVEVG
jgi:hypothetical protein